MYDGITLDGLNNTVSDESSDIDTDTTSETNSTLSKTVARSVATQNREVSIAKSSKFNAADSR